MMSARYPDYYRFDTDLLRDKHTATFEYGFGSLSALSIRVALQRCYYIEPYSDKINLLREM